jgi:hypothetical protein
MSEIPYSHELADEWLGCQHEENEDECEHEERCVHPVSSRSDLAVRTIPPRPDATPLS